MDLTEIKQRILEQYDISKTQISEMISNTQELLMGTRKLTELGNFEEEINPFLFNPDKLAPFGKEYWFFLLTGNEENFRDQVMVSFGRNKNNTMMIDNSKQEKDTDEYLGGIGEVWFHYGGKTTILGKYGGKIRYSSDAISFETEEYTIIFSGSYPNFNLKVLLEEKTIIDIDSQMPKSADAIEFFTFEKANFASKIGNAYLDFTGTVNGQPFRGRNYMQKVLMTAPFIPWYWGRFVFDNGSVLVFFLMWVEVSGIKKTVYSQAKIFDTETGDYVKIDDFKMKNIKGTNYWMLTHDSKNANYFVLLEAYANNVFRMKARGEFRYNEMFAEIKEIKIKHREKIFDNENLGRGVGSLEAATGIAF